MTDRALRILVIANLPPHVLGGAENQVARLVEAWILAGHSVEAAGHGIPDDIQTLGTTRVRTYRIRTLNSFGRLVRGASYALSLTRLARRIRRDIDVVYCRGIGDAALTIAVLKALGLLSWPLVACPINARGDGDVSFIRSIPGWRLWANLLDRHCNAINLIASGMADDLQAIGVRQPRITRIPNGITPLPPPNRDRVAPVRRLCWTGRLTAQKGLDLLLPALATVAAEGSRFSLNVIGEGPEQAALASQVEALGLKDRVHFEGALAAESIRDQLVGANVFVLPSRYEGMSNSALEAMEAALPVLCTRCGGIDEYVVDGAGWVCAPGSTKALEEALRTLFKASDAELLEMGRRARALVETQFALSSVAERNLGLLQSVVADTSGT